MSHFVVLKICSMFFSFSMLIFKKNDLTLQIHLRLSREVQVNLFFESKLILIKTINL